MDEAMYTVHTRVSEWLEDPSKLENTSGGNGVRTTQHDVQRWLTPVLRTLEVCARKHHWNALDTDARSVVVQSCRRLGLFFHQQYTTENAQSALGANADTLNDVRTKLFGLVGPIWTEEAFPTRDESLAAVSAAKAESETANRIRQQVSDLAEAEKL